MSFIQNFFTSRDNNANPDTYVGQKDRLWYNANTNAIRISDGVTPGGQPIALEPPANITLNSIISNVVITNSFTANSGTVNGDLQVTGNISVATTTKIGGIRAGPGANISDTGLLTIDTSGLPLSFGDFTANMNILTIVNPDENMILATQGNAEIQLVGNVGFYRIQSNGAPPVIGDKFFSANDTGKIEIFVPDEDPITGAVEIIGSSTGNVIAPGQPGAMLHLTGQAGIPCRSYYDGSGDFVGFVARRWNGNIASPEQVLSGEDVLRITTTAATNAGLGNAGFAQITFAALENQTPTAQGSIINFVVTPVGSSATNRTIVANVTVANGMSATKFTSAGEVTAAGNISTSSNITANGNVTAANITASTGIFTGNGSGLTNINASNISTGTLPNTVMSGTYTININGSSATTGTVTTNAQPNITSVGTLTSLAVIGNVTVGNLLSNGSITSNSATSGVGYRTGAGGSVTQLTDKTTAVTLNRITGQITTSNSTLNGDTSVTFTLNNSSIANTDVMIINHVSGGTIGKYTFYPICNNGNATITIRNITTGGGAPEGAELVLRYAVIKAAIT